MLGFDGDITSHAKGCFVPLFSLRALQCIDRIGGPFIVKVVWVVDSGRIGMLVEIKLSDLAKIGFSLSNFSTKLHNFT